MTRQEELMLVRRILSGDTDAFSQIVEEHQKTVYNLALRMTGDPQDAQDMAQESFIKAFGSLSSFRGDSKLSVWLYRIVSNVCVDFLRSRRRRAAESLNTLMPDGEELERQIPDLRALPEEELQKKLTREAVRNGLLTLPEDQRKILLMRELEGLSYSEIAAALDIEEGTVKSRIFRARRRLCAYLIEDGNIPASFSSNDSEGGGNK